MRGRRKQHGSKDCAAKRASNIRAEPPTVSPLMKPEKPKQVQHSCRTFHFLLRSFSFPGAKTARERFFLWKMGFSAAKSFRIRRTRRRVRLKARKIFGLLDLSKVFRQSVMAKPCNLPLWARTPQIDFAKNQKTPSGAALKPRAEGVCESDQALTAPDVMPSIYSRELNMNMSSSGIVAMTKPAIIAP